MERIFDRMLVTFVLEKKNDNILLEKELQVLMGIITTVELTIKYIKFNPQLKLSEQMWGKLAMLNLLSHLSPMCLVQLHLYI